MPLAKRFIAELIGTFWLVFGGCGSAVLAAVFPYDPNNPNTLGIALVGVSLAFGLTLLTMAYAIGHISGCHLNPAVSFGLWIAKRFPGSELLPYIIAQVIGGILAMGVIYLIVAGREGGLEAAYAGTNPMAANGFGPHSPGGFSLASCFIIELVLTFIFVLVILGATDRRAPQGFAPVPIGLCLTLIHLISIPVTNTSVNPARSLAPAIFAGPALFSQVWLFWVAPILGAIVAGYLYYNVFEVPASNPDHTLEEVR